MKWKQYDILLLLGCLFIFSCGIGWFHVGKRTQSMSLQTLIDIAQVTSEQQGDALRTNLETLTDTEIIMYLKVLIASRSVEKIVDTLIDIPIDRAIKIFKLIVEQPSTALLPWDKKELLVLLASTYKNQKDQDALLRLSQEMPLLQADGPLLITSAHLDDHKTLIPLVYNWYKRTATAQEVEHTIARAYHHSIKKNAPELFIRMAQSGVPISTQLATDLVHQVVTSNTNPVFISLIAPFKPDWNGVNAQKRTPLIEASMKAQYEMVQALLQVGVDPNWMPDPLIGTALQNVMKLILSKDSSKDAADIKKLVDVELLLRNNGAREGN